jgi:hypothetical protein
MTLIHIPPNLFLCTHLCHSAKPLPCGPLNSVMTSLSTQESATYLCQVLSILLKAFLCFSVLLLLTHLLLCFSYLTAGGGVCVRAYLSGQPVEESQLTMLACFLAYHSVPAPRHLPPMGLEGNCLC